MPSFCRPISYELSGLISEWSCGCWDIWWDELRVCNSQSWTIRKGLFDGLSFLYVQCGKWNLHKTFKFLCKSKLKKWICSFISVFLQSRDFFRSREVDVVEPSLWKCRSWTTTAFTHEPEVFMSIVSDRFFLPSDVLTCFSFIFHIFLRFSYLCFRSSFLPALPTWLWTWNDSVSSRQAAQTKAPKGCECWGKLDHPCGCTGIWQVDSSLSDWKSLGWWWIRKFKSFEPFEPKMWSHLVSFKVTSCNFSCSAI